MGRVVLAMSGGVDSSVAAHLLQSAGHEVIGVFMRHGAASLAGCRVGGPPERSRQMPVVSGGSSRRQGCCSAADAEDARRVAEQLQIPFFALDLQAGFRRIIDYFVGEYSAGRTPNPCVQCNNWLKFGTLFEYADGIGAECVATGHYARRIDGGPGGEPALAAGVDADKDQSYVLFGIERVKLPRVLLPVGAYDKSSIRGLARQLGWDVAEKRDSQEICFVGRGEHAELVRSWSGEDTSGELVTQDGRCVGRHHGLENFTIGQRKGLGVALGEPYYVVEIDRPTRRVVLGRLAELARSSLVASRTNWLADVGEEPFRCTAKIRYNSPARAATARRLPGERLAVEFDAPQTAIAPGQAVVCYDGERVLGGGWID